MDQFRELKDAVAKLKEAFELPLSFIIINAKNHELLKKQCMGQYYERFLALPLDAQRELCRDLTQKYTEFNENHFLYGDASFKAKPMGLRKWCEKQEGTC